MAEVSGYTAKQDTNRTGSRSGREKRPVANLPGMLGCGLLPLGRKDRYVYVYGVRVHRRRDCQLNAWPEFPATL